MTTRILPFNEWEKLDATNLANVWRLISPQWTNMIVVEDDDGAIIGTWMLMTIVNAEGLWIAPTHQRKAGVARRLLREMRKAAARIGVTKVMTRALDEKVARYLERIGAQRVPGEQYLIPVTKE